MDIIDSVKITDEEVDNIHLRSSEVKEILGQIPRRIIRYGIGVISCILVISFVFTFFFRYPDIINGSFYIQSSNPPAFLLARSSGKLQSLYVSDKDKVESGQLLAIIESSTSIKAYQNLKSYLKNTGNNQCEDLADLGELQIPFSSFKRAKEELATFYKIDYHNKKVNSLNKQKKELIRQIGFEERQFVASKKNTDLSFKMFERDSLLFSQQTIAAASFEKSKKDFVGQQMSLTSRQIALSNSRITLSGLEQQILELELDQSKEESRLKLAHVNSLDQLNGSVEEWESKYCIVSPIDGKVSFSSIWEENQNVRIGQHVMTVLPLQQSHILAKVSIPINRAGKVKAGQEINLKLTDFPFREYGMVVAKLNSISEVPDSVYIGTVVLNDTIVTNYGKSLPFKQNMQGVAEIITEDVSLAERLLYPFKEIFKRHIN